MNITLIHPSRGRSYKAYATYLFWLKQSSGKTTIEHILSIDVSDTKEHIAKYLELFQEKSTVILSNNTCVVEATNVACKYSKGNIIIYLSDDFFPPENWDIDLIDVFTPYMSRPTLLKVDDCLNKFTAGILTIPIMNSKLYKKLGYFWHPSYRSMFVDEDLYWVTKNNGWIIFCEQLKFRHEHHTNKMTNNDETYRRSELNWKHGKELFYQRKLQGFPL